MTRRSCKRGGDWACDSGKYRGPGSSSPTITSFWNDVSYNPTANGYQLPTEAEWLQAADDGHECSGADMANLGEVAWYKGNSGRKTHKVKTKAPNAKGIYDMSGNVS